MQEFTGYKGYLPEGTGVVPEVLPTSAADRVNFFYSAVYWYRNFTPDQPLNAAFNALDAVRDSALRGAQSIDTLRIKQAVDNMTPRERVDAITELRNHTPWHFDIHSEEDKHIEAAVAAIVATGPISLPRDPTRPDREPIADHLPDGRPNRIEMFYEIAERYLNSSSLTQEQSSDIQRALAVRSDAMTDMRRYEQGSYDQTAFHLNDAQRFELMDRLAPEIAASAHALNPAAGEFATEAVSRFTKARESSSQANAEPVHQFSEENKLVEEKMSGTQIDNSDHHLKDLYVLVSKGTRRVDAPDGEGYLKAIETGPANGLPEGRYSLAEAIEAAREIGHEYHGQVLHRDAKHLFQIAGKEVIKHELTEAAIQQLPEIGQQIAVTYSGAGPHFDPLSIDGINTAAEQPPHQHTESEIGAASMFDPMGEVEQEYEDLMNAGFEPTLGDELRQPKREHRPEQGATTEERQSAHIPEEWRGEACRLFDEEMAKRTGDASYDKAQRLSSALRQYEEMSFEPSKREQAILESRKQEIDESAKWIKENVLRNPLIKDRMYETVRDFGRDTGDPAIDRVRHEYLAEMEAKTIQRAIGRDSGQHNASTPRADAQQNPQRQQTEPPVADTPRNEVRADLIELFTHDPQGIEKFVGAEEGDMKASLADVKLEEMQSKMARNIDYAYELKSVHPDLFGKLADDGIKAKVAAHEKYDALAHKRDAKQAGPAADERERTQERERGNRQSIGSVRTSVEARVHEAREVLSRSAGLAPMVAVNAMKNNSNAQQSKGPVEQTKAKRGMSM